MIIFGILFGLLSGAPISVSIYLWSGEVDRVFGDFNKLSNNLNQSGYFLLYITITGLANIILNSISFALWKYISRKISKNLRLKYLKVFMKQELKDI